MDNTTREILKRWPNLLKHPKAMQALVNDTNPELLSMALLEDKLDHKKYGIDSGHYKIDSVIEMFMDEQNDLLTAEFLFESIDVQRELSRDKYFAFQRKLELLRGKVDIDLKRRTDILYIKALGLMSRGVDIADDLTAVDRIAEGSLIDKKSLLDDLERSIEKTELDEANDLIEKIKEVFPNRDASSPVQEWFSRARKDRNIHMLRQIMAYLHGGGSSEHPLRKLGEIAAVRPTRTWLNPSKILESCIVLTNKNQRSISPYLPEECKLSDDDYAARKLVDNIRTFVDPRQVPSLEVDDALSLLEALLSAFRVALKPDEFNIELKESDNKDYVRFIVAGWSLSYHFSPIGQLSFVIPLKRPGPGSQNDADISLEEDGSLLIQFNPWDLEGTYKYRSDIVILSSGDLIEMLSRQKDRNLLLVRRLLRRVPRGRLYRKNRNSKYSIFGALLLAIGKRCDLQGIESDSLPTLEMSNLIFAGLSLCGDEPDDQKIIDQLTFYSNNSLTDLIVLMDLVTCNILKERESEWVITTDMVLEAAEDERYRDAILQRIAHQLKFETTFVKEVLTCILSVPHELEKNVFTNDDIMELYEILIEKPVKNDALRIVLQNCQKASLLRFDAAGKFYNFRRNWACYVLQAKLNIAP